MKTIAERLTAIVVEQLGVGVDEVTPEAGFNDDLGTDSLDWVELVMACEEEFELEIPDEDIQPIKTVAEAVAYLERRIAEKPQKPAA